MFSILRPYIFSLDPEVAHDLAIQSLKLNILPKSFFSVLDEEMLETNLFINFQRTSLLSALLEPTKFSSIEKGITIFSLGGLPL